MNTSTINLLPTLMIQARRIAEGTDILREHFDGATSPIDRTALDEMFKLWEKCADLGIGGPHIRTLLADLKHRRLRDGKFIVPGGWIKERAIIANRILMVHELAHRDPSDPDADYSDLVGSTRVCPRTSPMAFIVAAVSFKTGVGIPLIMSASRRKRIAQARMLAYVLIQELASSKTIIQVARFFNRDHSTISHGVNAVRAQPGLMQEFNEMVAELRPVFDDFSGLA
jgi:hypothetical protein